MSSEKHLVFKNFGTPKRWLFPRDIQEIASSSGDQIIYSGKTNKLNFIKKMKFNDFGVKIKIIYSENGSAVIKSRDGASLDIPNYRDEIHFIYSHSEEIDFFLAIGVITSWKNTGCPRVSGLDCWEIKFNDSLKLQSPDIPEIFQKYFL